MELEDIRDEARNGNIAKIHDETARLHGDQLAIEHHGDEITHSDLSKRTATFAGGLREHGLTEGDIVLLYLPNCPEYLIGSIGAFRAGLVVSPVNPQYRTRELGYQMRDTDASAIVTHPALIHFVEEASAENDVDPLVITIGVDSPEGTLDFTDVVGDEVFVERDGDDIALLPYTSGTTGKPKGVMLTHDNFRAQTYSVLSQPSSLEPVEMKSLIWLPLYHITGFTHTAWQPLVRGGGLYMRSAVNWDEEECMSLIEEAGITHFVGVTAMYVDMVTNESFGDYDLSSLEVAGEGGAKMSVAIQNEFEETAGVDMAEGYGLTETCGATHSQSNSTYGLRHGTVGQPTRLTDCKIVDEDGVEVDQGEEGELLIRGPHVMKGYLNMPDETEEVFDEKGYFYTGDIALRESDNYYRIVDRKKHMIVSAGYNIYPSEVEELINEHEAVAETAIIGIPDERRNEVPKAFIVLKPGIEDVSEEEIKEFCLDSIAPYKHPREVEFLDELPRTASGKIKKYRLEEKEGE